MLFICYVLESQDDVDSLSRESVASDEIIPAAKTHKDDVISTGTCHSVNLKFLNLGYSMSI